MVDNRKPDFSVTIALENEMTKLSVKKGWSSNSVKSEPEKESSRQTSVPLDPLEKMALEEYLLAELRGLEDDFLADSAGTDSAGTDRRR